MKGNVGSCAALLVLPLLCGCGEPTTPTPVPRVTPPDAPRIIEVIPGSGRLTIQFTPPASDGGGQITEYRYSVDNASDWTASQAAVAVSSLLVEGLENGRTYSVAIRAVNAAGPGSPAITTGTPATTPSRVRITRITPGDGTLSVAFNAPDSGGYRISGYQYSTDAGKRWVLADSVLPAGPVVISRLVNGTAYSVVLRAMSFAGIGEASETVIATPMTVPGVPAIKAIVAKINVLALSLDSPGSDGGAAITGFDYSLDSGSTWASAGDTTSSSFDIAGLSWRVRYAVRVRARNQMGAGAASPAVIASPLGLAGSPTVTGVNAGDGTLSVEFSAPEHSGSSPVAGYEYSLDSGTTWLVLSAQSAPNRFDLAGLRNGDQYRVAIRAVTAVGKGPMSNVVGGMPFVFSPRIDSLRVMRQPVQSRYIPQMLDDRDPTFDLDAQRALQRFRALRGRDAVTLFEKVQAAADYVATMAKHPYRHKLALEFSDPRSWEYQDLPVRLSQLAKENQQWDGLEWVPAPGKTWLDIPAIECSFQDLILGGIVNAFGAQWMLIGITHHDGFTYYDYELGKWVYIESTYNEHYRRAQSSADDYVPLSPAELREMSLAGDNSMVAVRHPYQPQRSEPEFYLHPYVQIYPSGFEAMMAGVNGITSGERMQRGSQMRVLPGGTSDEVFRTYLDGGWEMADPNEDIWAPQGETFIESLVSTPRGNVIRLATNLAVTSPVYERRTGGGEWVVVSRESELNGLVGEIRFRARSDGLVSGEVVISQAAKP